MSEENGRLILSETGLIVVVIGGQEYVVDIWRISDFIDEVIDRHADKTQRPVEWSRAFYPDLVKAINDYGLPIVSHYQASEIQKKIHSEANRLKNASSAKPV